MAIDREATLKNAEKFLRVGRLDAAIAEYVRVVEDQPKDWNTANTLGDLYMRAGQSGRAVPLYSRVANHLLAEGFYPKAAALFRKILKITPDDEETLLRLAEISSRQGLLADAKTHYVAVEKKRRQREDGAGADEIVVRLGSLDPEDLDARLAAARASERGGHLVEAARQYRELHDEFLGQGREADAQAALRDCVRCNPELKQANLLPLARIELRAGRLDHARPLVADLLAAGSDSRDALVELASDLVASSPAAAALCIDAAADSLVGNGAFAQAATVLEQFADRLPDRVETLLKLVEVCVDGGLEEMMFTAQARLADAYLSAGSAAEARVIAEDLVARDPGNAAHHDRLLRALQALNIGDVDAALAERISASEPVDEPIAESLPAPAAAIVTEAPPLVDAPPPVRPEPSTPEESRPVKPPSVEIDLTNLLGELQGQAAAPEPPAKPSRDLEQVFSDLRADVENDEEAKSAQDHVDLATTYLEMGMREEAVGSLQIAARSPKHRFAASCAIGEVYRDDGDLRAAIEWLERAAEAPPPSAEQGRALLYDLGDLLETVGETARALAVFLELNAEAANYRDVTERVTRLSNVETEG